MIIPGRPLTIKPYWIQRDLSMVNLGSGYFWERSQRWMGPQAINGGPVKRYQPLGVVTGFGSTLGTGTTDRVGGPVVTNSAQVRSIVFWSYARGLGGSSGGRVVTTRGNAGGAAQSMLVAIANTAGQELAYNAIASTINLGSWSWPGAGTGPPLSVWRSYGVNHDQTSILNTPLMWINGQPVTPILASAPVGAYTPTAAMLDFGNRSTDNARGWDGMLGPCYIFDGPTGLTDQEHAILAANPLALFEMPEEDVFAFSSGVSMFIPRVGEGALVGQPRGFAG